jgi:tRNA(adenine34) deaminase
LLGIQGYADDGSLAHVALLDRADVTGQEAAQGPAMTQGQSGMTAMDIALEEACSAAARGEIPVGAVVLAPDGTVLARAGNAMEAQADASAHAELQALRAAAAVRGEPRLPNCELVVTLEPCPMCAQAISLFRIRRLVFGAYDAKGGGVEHGARVFDASSCHHRPEVVGGVRESESAELLRAFFQARR